MSQVEQLVDLTASDHGEVEASRGERQARPASPVVAKRKPGRPPLPPGQRKPPRPKSNRPAGRPRKHPKKTEDGNLVTGTETGHDLQQPKRNHESIEDRTSPNLDEDLNEHRPSDRLSKQGLQDIEKDRGSIDLDGKLPLGTIGRERRLMSGANTRLDVEGFNVQNTTRQTRQSHLRQLLDDGFSSRTSGDVPAAQGRTRRDQPLRHETHEASNDVPYVETRARRNHRTKYQIIESSDDALSPGGRAHHDQLPGYSTQNWPDEEQEEPRTSLQTQMQKKRKLTGPKQTVDGADLESRPSYYRQEPNTAKDLHGLENLYKAKKQLGSRSNPQVRNQALQPSPSNRFPTSVDQDDHHSSQRHKRRYSLGSDNAQQDLFSPRRIVGEKPHAVGQKLIGINRKGLSDKSHKPTMVIRSSDDETEHTQVELLQDRQLVKTVTKEIFEEHLDWLECYDVPVDFDESWSKEDEIELLWHWSQADEDMINAFTPQEMPLWVDMKKIWGLTPPRCLPDGYEFSIKDNDFLEDGRQNTNLSARNCDLLYDCLLLPAFRDALPFFHFMVKKAVYLRLRNSPYKVEKPREVNLMIRANEEHLSRIDETIDSYAARFVNSAESDTLKAIEDLKHEISLLEVNRSRAKKLNSYDHLAFRHELRIPSSRDNHDKGVTPGDLSAILEAWRIYADKQELRQAPWYRAALGSAREASDIPSPTFWARWKKATAMYKDRSAKVLSRRETAELKEKILCQNRMQDKTYGVGVNVSREGHAASTVAEHTQQTPIPDTTAGVRTPSPVIRSVSGQNPRSSGQVQSSLGQHLGAGNASKAPIQRQEARKAIPKVKSVGGIGQEASKIRTPRMEEKDLGSGRSSPHQEPLSGTDILEPVADTRSASKQPDRSTAEVRESVQRFPDLSQDRHTPIVGTRNPTALMSKQAKPIATAVGETKMTEPAPAEVKGQEGSYLTASTRTEKPIEDRSLKSSKEANKLDTTGFTDTARYEQHGIDTEDSYDPNSSSDDEYSDDEILELDNPWDHNLEMLKHTFVSTEYSSFLSACRIPKVPPHLRYGGQYIKDNFEQ